MLIIAAIVLGVIFLGKKTKSTKASPLARASALGEFEPTGTTIAGVSQDAPEYGHVWEPMDNPPHGVQFTQEQIGRVSVLGLMRPTTANKPNGVFPKTTAIAGFAGVVQGSNYYSKIKVQ